MKFSELKFLVEKLSERPHFNREGDPEVVIRTVQGGVPYNKMVGVRYINPGFDWTSGLLMIAPEEPMVTIKVARGQDLKKLARERLEQIKGNYEALGQKYIAKAREEEWIDGFLEGFNQFKVNIGDVQIEKDTK